MQSEAKRRGNAKYNAKCDQIMIKPLRPEGESIRAAAAAAGQSLQGYVLAAVRARMAHGAQATEDGDRIRLSLRSDAVQGLEADGETPAQAAARLLADAIRQARQDT
jgi:hypothetical protein